MSIFLFLVISLLFAGLFNYFKSKRKNIATPPEKITTVPETKPVEMSKKVFKYPKFIPYYKWHGWKKGLHPSTKQEILNQHNREGLI